MRGSCGEARQIARYIGGDKLSSVTIAMINGWMAQMTKDGYKLKTCAKALRLLNQALKWAVAQDLITKSPCTSASRPSA